jgi:hypothetical protein
MVLKYQRCENSQNLKPNNNSTFQQNLINSRYTIQVMLLAMGLVTTILVSMNRIAQITLGH